MRRTAYATIIIRPFPFRLWAGKLRQLFYWNVITPGAFRLLAKPLAVTQGFVPDGQKHDFSILSYARKTPIIQVRVWVCECVRACVCVTLYR